MGKDGRLAGADFMRALACMMVLAHHLVLRLDLDRLPPDLQPAFRTARFGNYGVAVFFVLSGFLLSRPFWKALKRRLPMPSLKVYALRRAARILPGYWFALTVGFVLSFTVYDATLDTELFGRYLAGFLLMSQWHWRTFFPVQGNGPLWSIPFEATCYVLLPLSLALLFAIRRRTGKPYVASIAWIGIIALTLGLQWLVVRSFPTDDIGRGWRFGFQGGAKEWMPRYNPIGFFAIFAIGALAGGMQIAISGRRSPIHDMLGLGALIAIAVTICNYTGDTWEGYGWFGIPYGFPAFPVAVAIGLWTLPQSTWLGSVLDSAVARFIATISFGTYIWQDVVISLIVRLFPSAFGIGAPNMLSGWFVSSTIAIILVFAIATLSYLLLERPVMRWARRLEHGTPPGARGPVPGKREKSPGDTSRTANK